MTVDGVGAPCHPGPVSPTDIDAARIRVGNVRVPHSEFLTVWREARRREAELGDAEVVDWYLAAVVQTCRWVAAIPMRTALCGGLARSPVTGRACLAHEGLIEAEWQAAQSRGRFSAELAARPGWCKGVHATLRWAWCGQGRPPIEAPPP